MKTDERTVLDAVIIKSMVVCKFSCVTGTRMKFVGGMLVIVHG